METFPSFKPENLKKRQHPAEFALDEPEMERAKRRYISEFLSSGLTALSLREDAASLRKDGAGSSTDLMDVEDIRKDRSASRRKNVVRITDLDAEISETDKSEEEEECGDELKIKMPRELRKSLKKIPTDLLKTKIDPNSNPNPVRALVLYKRPDWLPPPEDQEQNVEKVAETVRNTTNDNVKIVNDKEQIDGVFRNDALICVEDASLPEIEMDMDVEYDTINKRNSYDGYLGDDDDDGMEY